MDDGRDALALRFETERPRLRAVAHRMLGSLGGAEDAVQEAWLRLGRVDADGIDNLAAWLTTVVSRICLDMLRSRTARPEDPVGQQVSDRISDDGEHADPEREALLVDSVGRALLVVLDRLGPAERVAFVLHDLFAVPFEQIAAVLERSPAAAKKLASRARQRVHGAPLLPRAELDAHRHVVEAFLTASRGGDLDALVAVLAPEVVRRSDPAAVPAGAATVARGRAAVLEGVAAFGRRAGTAAVLLVNGQVGAVVAPGGRLRVALTFTVGDGLITGYEVIADPARLRALELAVLDPD
ncbi:MULTISPECIES: sigma-70 family RNA polymerase sigma factor [Streptacidiphilus]|uniref:Sigma-70 family RNA polymerase sigma factor n=1 Tax=Streptacidiphilus cavernicola TaxID=3342716 RepID=A0ABV6UEH2_9ACTN|nr:sigma-70 family RNA polymerase sigma factor [Streptacidiphilus jeojiense]